jgi:hypothetical protein
MMERDTGLSQLRGFFVDLTRKTPRLIDAELAGAEICDGIDRESTLTVVPAEEEGAMLLGIRKGDRIATVKLSNEDTIWLGRQMIDRANR